MQPIELFPCSPLQAVLAAQKAEAEATASRNLQFIDRMMLEKDALSGKRRAGLDRPLPSYTDGTGAESCYPSATLSMQGCLTWHAQLQLRSAAGCSG